MPFDERPQTTREAKSVFSGKSFIDKVLLGADDRWPQLKYFSLALYSAWILLTMTNNGATGSVVLTQAGIDSAEFYLLSGVPLSACLILSAVFVRQATNLINNRLFVLLMGAVASIGTVLLAMGSIFVDVSVSRMVFSLCGVLTGLGTSFVCLRIGSLYSAPPQGFVPFFIIVKVMLVANLLFFMCVSIPHPVADVALGLLPFLAALASLVGKRVAGGEKDESDLVSLDALPHGFFWRLLLAIFVFGLVAGVAKGCSALLQSSADIELQAIIVVFSSLVISGVIMLIAGIVLSLRNYEVSKLYFPMLGCSCATVLLCLVSDGSTGALQNVVINVGYNMFIVAAWAILSDLSERTTVPAVRVFGLGRGASGLGTTIGWFIAYGVMSLGMDPSQYLTPFFLVSVVVVFVVVLLVLGQQTVSEAIERMYEGVVRSSNPARCELDRSDPFEAWERACDHLAQQCGLTARETEVLKLLSRGRTGGYIALELTITQNTVKGHTRNVYAKTGVHSRQELIDRLERVIAEGGC